MIEDILRQVRIRIFCSGKKCNKKIDPIDLFKKYLYDSDIPLSLTPGRLPIYIKIDPKNPESLKL